MSLCGAPPPMAPMLPPAAAAAAATSAFVCKSLLGRGATTAVFALGPPTPPPRPLPEAWRRVRAASAFTPASAATTAYESESDPESETDATDCECTAAPAAAESGDPDPECVLVVKMTCMPQSGLVLQREAQLLLGPLSGRSIHARGYAAAANALPTVMNFMQHPGGVVTPGGDVMPPRWSMIMYRHGRNLQEVVVDGGATLCLAQVQHVATQVAAALEAAHTVAGVAHMDVQPKNIMLRDHSAESMVCDLSADAKRAPRGAPLRYVRSTAVVLGDWGNHMPIPGWIDHWSGCAVLVRHRLPSADPVAACYRAPEAWTQATPSDLASAMGGAPPPMCMFVEAMDIWAFAITMLELHLGRSMGLVSWPAMLKWIEAWRERTGLWRQLAQTDAVFADWCHRALHPDPFRRASLSELMSHRFLNGPHMNLLDLAWPIGFGWSPTVRRLLGVSQ